MKNLLLTSLSLLLVFSAFAQSTEKWTAVWNEESELIGFENSEGEVMIEPKFMGLTFAREFENIIAVMEETNGEYEAYYLTKSGREVGRDSLYFFDNGADCENEGFIRFTDKKTDKVGLFDRNGNIAIPAAYDALSRVHSGLIRALKGAKKQRWANHEESGCNHYSWKGGQSLLLNTENKVLIEDFSYEGVLDFYSMSVQNEPSEELTKVSFKGVDGRYYTFTDLEKEFEQWVKTELLSDLTNRQLQSSSMDSVTYWDENNGWLRESKQTYLDKDFELVKARLHATQEDEIDYFVSIGGLNPFMYTGEQYSQYFNTCGEAKQEKYPTMTLIINKGTGSEFMQDQIGFLKTEKGYRLIEVSISDI